MILQSRASVSARSCRLARVRDLPPAETGSSEKTIERLQAVLVPPQKPGAKPAVNQRMATPVGDKTGYDKHDLMGPEHAGRQCQDRSLVPAEYGCHLVVDPLDRRMERPKVLQSGPGALLLARLRQR